MREYFCAFKRCSRIDRVRALPRLAKITSKAGRVCNFLSNKRLTASDRISRGVTREAAQIGRGTRKDAKTQRVGFGSSRETGLS